MGKDIAMNNTKIHSCTEEALHVKNLRMKVIKMTIFKYYFYLSYLNELRSLFNQSLT